jgi:hypothetical protein
MMVVGFIVEDDFANVVDWSLHFVDISGFLPLYHQGNADDLSGAAMYRRRVSLGSGEARIGGLEIRSLTSSSTFCAPFVQQKQSDFFNILYKGSPRSPRQDTKWLRDARHPMSHWTSLTFLT